MRPTADAGAPDVDGLAPPPPGVGAAGAELTAQRERTLRAAWLISAWAPLGTTVAFVAGGTAVQLADLVRRNMELLALIVAWAVYRHVARKGSALGAAAALRLESRASLVVGALMTGSAVAVLYTAWARFVSPQEAGWLLPGLLVAIGGTLVNSWFWWRSWRLNTDSPSPVVSAHWHLYRAKTAVDGAVLATLVLAGLETDARWVALADPIGTALVGAFLAYSGVRLVAGSVRALRGTPAG